MFSNPGVSDACFDTRLSLYIQSPRIHKGIKEKENSMEVRLKQEWFGNTAGTIIKVNDDRANSLFQRDIAEKMEPESNVAIKEKLQRMVANKVKK
jgi:hypothetical protein